MSKRRKTTITFSRLFLAVGVIILLSLLYIKFAHPQKKAEIVDERELLNLLPEEAQEYKLISNGFSPNQNLFSVTIYFPNDMFDKNIETSIDNPNVGNWIIDINTKKSHRIASWETVKGTQFLGWVDDSHLEILSDGEQIAGTIDIMTGQVTHKRIYNLSFELVNDEDERYEVAQFTVEDTQDKECNVSKQVVQRWFNYPFNCVKKGLVTITVPGYKNSFTLSYINESTIAVNGKQYSNLLEEKRISL